MNLENVSALVIRLFGAYQFFLAIYDVVEVLIDQAIKPSYDNYHAFSLWIGTRIFFGLIAFYFTIPLGKRIVKGLT